MRLGSADLELGLKEPESGPANALQILRRHDITIRNMDAEIDEKHARYDLQVRVHAALTELSALTEVKRVSLTGFRDYE
jgi:hypothetical protein